MFADKHTITKRNKIEKLNYIYLIYLLNLITYIYLPHANIGNVWASQEVKLILCMAFFCSKFMQCLEFRFLLHAVQTYERWK